MTVNVQKTMQDKFQSSRSYKAAEYLTAEGQALEAILKKHKLSKDEYNRLLEIVGRLPTMTELGVFSAMWSEHCSYKSSKVHLKKLPTKGPAVVVGPGENAGVVRIKDSLCLAFKMESHNHPSYIEPYQGAATGVGGILRDVFCMGARPIANLNCLRFGRKDHPYTAHLVEHVVKGIGDYGNCVGIPTVGGNVFYDQSYDGNCLVNAMTVGLIHEDQIFKGYASGPGNLVVYVGSATGRDGIHGATMASDSFESKEQGERSTVQVGDPFTEKLLLEATLESLKEGLVIGLQDMGAAGLTSSSFEMADRAGTGLFIDLDRVPVRADKMTAYELMLSESQERMLMVIEPKNWDALKKLLQKWELAHDVIGIVTETGRMQISYQGKLEVDVPIAPLADSAPMYERPFELPAKRAEVMSQSQLERISEKIKQDGFEKTLQAALDEASGKEWIYQQYDHHIGSRTRYHSGHGGAAVLSLWDERIGDERLGMAVSTSCSVRYNRADAFFGGQHAIVKSARMIAAAGGVPLAATDCMNYGNPERPHVMGQFVDGIQGMSQACQALGVAIVSGNVSLYNETDGQGVAPTPMIGMVGRVDDINLSKPGVCTETGNLYLLTHANAQAGFGASVAAAYAIGSESAASVPYLMDLEAEAMLIRFLPSLFSQSPEIQACRDVGDGGVLTTLIKMLQANGFGATLKTPEPITNPALFWFAERGASYLVATKQRLSDLPLANKDLRCIELGSIQTESSVTVDGRKIY